MSAYAARRRQCRSHSPSVLPFNELNTCVQSRSQVKLLSENLRRCRCHCTFYSGARCVIIIKIKQRNACEGKGKREIAPRFSLRFGEFVKERIDRVRDEKCIVHFKDIRILSSSLCAYLL